VAVLGHYPKDEYSGNWFWKALSKYPQDTREIVWPSWTLEEAIQGVVLPPCAFMRLDYDRYPGVDR